MVRDGVSSKAYTRRVIPALATLPPEIRSAIYSYFIPQRLHVSIRRGILLLTKCVTPDPYSDPPGFDAATSGKYIHDRVWFDRLRSSWGPHWRCEELAAENQRACSPVYPSLFLVACKWLYLDIRTHMAAVTEFNVTDIEQITSLLVQRSETHAPVPPLYDPLYPSLCWAKRVSISMRIPLSLCPLAESKCVDTHTSQHNESIHQDVDTAPSRLWVPTSDLLYRLPYVISLSIWLDHDGLKSWSVVDERTLLAPLLTIVTEISVSTGQPFSIILHIPNLHPLKKHPSTHLFGANLPLHPNIRLCRRLRQRWHSKPPFNDSRLNIDASPDFPFLYYQEFLAGHRYGSDLEEYEEEQLRAGVDLALLATKGMYGGVRRKEFGLEHDGIPRVR